MFSWYRGKTPIQKELPATASTEYKLGDALAYGSAGTIVKATGTTKPEFICASKDFTAEAGDFVVGQVIEEDMEFKTTFSAAATSIKLGNKVTIGADGDSVTATTTNGIAEVIEMNGTASGSEVVIKF